MKTLLLLTLTTLTSLYGFGQYSSPDVLQNIIATYPEERLVLESSRLLEEGYYAAAEQVVDKLLLMDPENANYNYRKGFLLLEGRINYKGAIMHLEKAITNVARNYDMYSGSEKGAAVDSYFRLAKAYHRIGNLDKAEQYYRLFLSEVKKKTELTVSSELGLIQIENARKAIQTPKKNVEIVNLGELINTKYPEYSPVVSFDGSSLYYTSRRPWPDGKSDQYKDPRYDLFSEDIYVAYRDFDGEWLEPARLDFCEADQNEASVSVSIDEHRIYIYEDTKGNGDIFFSDFSTNRFKEVQHYPNKDVNSKFWDTHVSVTPDGRTMYFSSERPEGFGGRDIYRIVQLPDGTWSKPQNLGPTINSESDEDSPFMASDNRTLYFASNGPKSIGGFDILVSVIDEDNNWSAPINLGYPANSTGDDVFYTETIDGRRGYITSMREDSHGEKDIYEIRNHYMDVKRGTILKGKVITLNDVPMPEDITVTLTCIDCSTPTKITVYPRSRDGLFMMNLDPCHEFEVIFHHRNGEVEFYRETLKTACKENEELYREIYLDAERIAIVPKPEETDTTPVVVTEPVKEPVVAKPDFQEVSFKYYFGYNKNKLTASTPDLKRFFRDIDKQIKEGRSEILIEINSSASQVPTRAFANNEELSKLRAYNMKQLLENQFSQAKYKGRVKVLVIAVKVTGPAFEDDASNREKYEPYQFVEVKTK